ncbi:MAG: insulinase family protein [Firmicutes bacterium]|nr:insulinase family protein [Bacillota bacterium]
MKTIHLEPLHETIVEFVSENGLNVRILPKKGFVKTSVSLQIGFGSIDVFVRNSNGDFKLPDGIAHFLEHMIFENTDKDISKSFTEIGASVNAYTTYNRTVYYFSTASPLEKGLNLLLETVFHPEFDSEQIEKERKIISSEIQMYEDDLEQSLYYDTMKLMYKHHPISSDIAGTKESIAQINETVLKTAFDVFYHPENALLVISGDVDTDFVKDLVNAKMSGINFGVHHQTSLLIEDEHQSIVSPRLSVKKDMMNSFVMIGIRLDLPFYTPSQGAIEEMKLLLLMDNFFSKSSEFYKTLQKQKAINNNFDFSVTVEPSFAHILFFAETKTPEKTASAIKSMILKIKTLKLDVERFVIQKRKIIGQFVQIFNSTSSASALVSEYALKNTRIDELIASIESFDIEEMTPLVELIQEDKIVEVIYHS